MNGVSFAVILDPTILVDDGFVVQGKNFRPIGMHDGRAQHGVIVGRATVAVLTL